MLATYLRRGEIPRWPLTSCTCFRVHQIGSNKHATSRSMGRRTGTARLVLPGSFAPSASARSLKIRTLPLAARDTPAKRKHSTPSLQNPNPIIPLLYCHPWTTTITKKSQISRFKNWLNLSKELPATAVVHRLVGRPETNQQTNERFLSSTNSPHNSPRVYTPAGKTDSNQRSARRLRFLLNPKSG